jgi:hypothetical protein
MARLTALLLIAFTAQICSAETQATPGEATLLYVYSPDCGACIQFMAEAGAIYPKTREANLMPMTRVTLETWQAGNHPLAACDVAPVFGTPTFVQIRNCIEIDRITGYSSDEMWWFSLQRMVDRLSS